MLLEDIVNHINNHLPTYTLGEELFANYYPDDPDNIISVIAEGGFPPGKYTPSREITFDIKIRNTTFSEGYSIGNQIMNLFHSKENYQIGNTFVSFSYATTEVSYLYADSKNRDQFSLELAFLLQN